MGENYILEDHIFDELVDYLRNNDISDLLSIVGDAVSYLEIDTYAKESEIQGDITNIVDFCKKNIIPDGTMRRKILFREIAIWANNNGMTKNEIEKLDSEIISNCPGRKKGEIVAWVDWVKKHKPKQNIKSVNYVMKLIDDAGGADHGKG